MSQIGPASLERVDPPHGFPAEVDVLGQTWRIVYCSNLTTEHGLYGRTDPAQRLILIDTSQARTMMEDTLWHELLHAALATSACHDLDDIIEERVLRTLTPAVLSVLKKTRPWWRRRNV